MRYRSADAMADDLDRLLAGEAVEAKSHNRVYVIRKVLRRYRVPISVTAAFIFVLVGAMFVTTRARHRAEEASRRYQMSLVTGTITEQGELALQYGETAGLTPTHGNSLQGSSRAQVGETP